MAQGAVSSRPLADPFATSWWKDSAPDAGALKLSIDYVKPDFTRTRHGNDGELHEAENKH
jgi:hypothetical protein